MPQHATGRVLDHIENLLGRGQAAAAEEMTRSLLANQPNDVQAQVLLGHALRMQARRSEALDIARQAQSADPKQPAARMLVVDLLIEQGERAHGFEILRTLDADGDAWPARLLQDVAQRYTLLGLHHDAERCQARASARQPDDPRFLYNHATSLIALGRLDEAEAVLDRVITLTPDDGDAWYNRSTLRRQTASVNHVAALRQQLEKSAASSPVRVPLGYALAKELEDLGEYRPSFAALKDAADGRRQQLRYRVQDDIDTMGLIAEAFDQDFFAHTHQGHDDTRPVFIVGLPRSGTTLVDRILSSHPAISSRGETSDLVLALMTEAGRVGGKAELVRRSTTLDFEALGRRYSANLDGTDHARLIDKTPANFLYAGIIAAALPHARIIHLRRNPMDACYAMYKTLFRMAYPFSYDLDDLAQYWLAYDRLMAHWRRVLPAGQMLEISYEELVAGQETISRKLLEFVGQPWDDACLAFERNPEPSLTASAAQVRQPIYRSSVGLWRCHEDALSPLRAILQAAGVDTDTAEALP